MIMKNVVLIGMGTVVIIAAVVAFTARGTDVATEPASRAPDGWDVRSGSAITAEDRAEQREQAELEYLAQTRPISGSSQTYTLHLVPSRDELLIPFGLRKPDGPGPFPIVLMGSGNGRGGFERVDEAMYRLEPMMDMMLERGYAVAYVNYRNEIPHLYNQIARCENVRDDISGGARALKSTPCLDSDDFIELIEHAKVLEFTDPDGVGTIGVSHNGELQLKAATITSWGAAVAIEGAAHEFLAVDTDAAPRRDDGRLMWLPDVESTVELADMDTARSRIGKIDTPFLHIGRGQDHLQGIFRLSYELSRDAGKDATWFSYAHDVHGFGFLYRNEDGSFSPDEVQREAFTMWMDFFDRHLKPAQVGQAD
jgi:hypothetical protein